MKIWTPEQPSRHYAASILLPLIGSVLLAVVLAGGAALLALRQGWPVAPISLAGCALAVFFALWAALAVGRRAQQGALIFCQDGQGRLFAVDARKFISYHKSLLGYLQTQKVVRRLVEGGVLARYLGEEKGLVGLENQILAVENIKENRNAYALTCRVRHPSGSFGRHTYLLVKGYTRQEELLYALERLRTAENLVELPSNRKPLFILLCSVALAVCIALCVCSHPAVGVLSQEIYFPCLGLAFALLFPLLYFIIRQHRGE